MEWAVRARGLARGAGKEGRGCRHAQEVRGGLEGGGHHAHPRGTVSGCGVSRDGRSTPRQRPERGRPAAGHQQGKRRRHLRVRPGGEDGGQGHADLDGIASAAPWADVGLALEAEVVAALAESAVDPRPADGHGRGRAAGEPVHHHPVRARGDLQVEGRLPDNALRPVRGDRQVDVPTEGRSLASRWARSATGSGRGSPSAPGSRWG